MHKFLAAALFIIVLCSANTASAEHGYRAEAEKLTDGCWSGPDLEMNACVKIVLDKADHQMKEKYRRLRFALHNPKSLIKAQRSWIAFRDAECLTDTPSIYEPQSDYAGEYLCMLALTLERNRHLDWRISNDCIGETECPELPKVQQGVQADVR